MTNNVSEDEFADCQQAPDLRPVECSREMWWDGSLASQWRGWKFWKQQLRGDGCDIFHLELRYKNEKLWSFEFYIEVKECFWNNS